VEATREAAAAATDMAGPGARVRLAERRRRREWCGGESERAGRWKREVVGVDLVEPHGWHGGSGHLTWGDAIGWKRGGGARMAGKDHVETLAFWSTRGKGLDLYFFFFVCSFSLVASLVVRVVLVGAVLRLL
jgi:hypothetical protein